jgi:hypothetical protein
VPNRVRVIGTGYHDKLLEVISGLPHLAPKIALSSGDELLIGITNVLVVITLVAASSDHDSLGLLLQPLLVAFGAPLHALIGCLGGTPRPLPGATFPLFYMKMARPPSRQRHAMW